VKSLVSGIQVINAKRVKVKVIERRKSRERKRERREKKRERDSTKGERVYRETRC